MSPDYHAPARTSNISGALQLSQLPFAPFESNEIADQYGKHQEGYELLFHAISFVHVFFLLHD
jgi:hypothetical protein